MKKFLATVAIGLGLGLTAAPVLAQSETTADTVVATVNGAEITFGHLIIARNELPAQYQQIPDELLFPGLLDQIIQLEVLKSSFTGDVPASVTYGVENKERSLVAGVAIAQLLETEVTEEMIEDAYTKKYAEQDLGLEYNASHILVDAEEDALTILEELKGGADFATAAQTHSTGPSGPRGGLLGWFRRGEMVPAFDEAVAGMEVGKLAGPVQTQFGFHLIRLNETRRIEAPELDEVREEIADELGQVAIEDLITSLMETADVDRVSVDAIDPAALRDQTLLEN